MKSKYKVFISRPYDPANDDEKKWKILFIKGIKPAINSINKNEKVNYELEIYDAEQNPGIEDIKDKVPNKIDECDIFLCVLSEYKANIMYEAGYSKKCGLPSIYLLGKTFTMQPKPILIGEPDIYYYEEDPSCFDTIPMELTKYLLKACEAVKHKKFPFDEKGGAHEGVFQDFRVSRKHGSVNVNPVLYFWADAFTNSKINALVMKEQAEFFLRVWYENANRTEAQSERFRGWSSNVAIGPKVQPFFTGVNDGGLKYRSLQFSARRHPVQSCTDHVPEEGLSVRVIDRQMTHWEYKNTGSDAHQFHVPETDEFITFDLSLEPDFFKVFPNDGYSRHIEHDNDRKPQPDFSVLRGIVFTLGSYSFGFELPRDGKGVVDIKDIRLVDAAKKDMPG